MKRSQAEDFVIAPRLPFWARMAVSAFLVSGAFFLQMEGAQPVKAAGFALMVVFVVLNWVRKVKITRDKKSGAKEWQTTTSRQFTAALAKLSRINSFVHSAVSGVIFWVMLAFLTPVLLIIVDLLPRTQSMPVLFLAVDGLLILFVVFSSGNRSIWTPVGLKMKLVQLQTLIGLLEKDADLIVEPQFLLEKKGEKSIPLDAKLMVRIRSGMPQELIGMQISLALNAVQGKSHPYLYAVLVARSSFDLKQKIKATKTAPIPKNLLMEFKNQKDNIQVAVIRQNTTISKGYWTQKKAVSELVGLSLGILKRIVSENTAALPAGKK